jgi:hypothetical protein
VGRRAPRYQLTTGIVRADPERLVGLDVCSWVAVLQGAPEPIHQNRVSVAISTPARLGSTRRGETRTATVHTAALGQKYSHSLRLMN